MMLHERMQRHAGWFKYRFVTLGGGEYPVDPDTIQTSKDLFEVADMLRKLWENKESRV